MLSSTTVCNNMVELCGFFLSFSLSFFLSLFYFIFGGRVCFIDKGSLCVVLAALIYRAGCP